MSSAAFLLALLDRDDPACVAHEDFEGAHGEALRAWQELGFVSREPGLNPTAGCPYCDEGAPYQIGGRYLCAACRSEIQPGFLWLWPLDRDALLRYVSTGLRLWGGVRPIDGRLWQLGSGTAEGGPIECFYRRRGPLSDAAQRRLDAYRRVLVLHGPSMPPEPGRAVWVPLVELFHPNGSPAIPGLNTLLRTRGAVRFDTHSGALWVGATLLGEVPVGSREFFFLQCLAEQLDHFVPYADLKREVLLRSGSTDSTEEATFCQVHKSRIKKRWVPAIDRLIGTTNKGDGYRLRGHAEL